MRKYVCSVCSFVYDESAGAKWEDLPGDWVCPVCGTMKEEFREQEAAVTPDAKAARLADHAGEMRELTALEKSALCSNLARGLEKQYKPEESRLYLELAGYFKASAEPAPPADFDGLLALIEKDLDVKIPEANSASVAAADRGALRALAWNEKVTRILKSLLTRYGHQGALPDDAGVFVCTICGFVHIGDQPPEACPVCRVPGWKFEKVEGR